MTRLLIGLLALSSLSVLARTFELRINNYNDFKKSFVQIIEQENQYQKIIISADESLQLSYEENYPNGDFYFLTGDLRGSWAKRDFQKMYGVVRWLGIRGFRTILVPNAYLPDIEEAVQNKNTSAILWNSHGSKDGTVRDFNNQELPTHIFLNMKSENLKYILFANCWGEATAEKYGLSSSSIKTGYWKGKTDSSKLFSFLNSTGFDKQLEEAMGKPLIKKPIILND